MAITFDKALGSNHGNVPLTLTITTGATAAAGSRIVVCLSWFDSAGAAVSVSDGTAYTLDKRFDNGSDHFAVYSRVLVGSLASGSSITVTFSGTTTGLGGALIAACSYLGTTGVDTNATNATSGTGFSSGAASNAVTDALFVGGAGNEVGTPGSVGGTNTNGTQRFDIWDSAAGQGMRMLDLIASSIASQALTGTWANSSTATTGVLVIYKGTATASPTVHPVYLPRRLGPGAVGPTFFAPFPPAAPGISPPPGGLPGIPVYLPRRLGPGAVGPPFFARFPVPAPGASAGPAAIWLPPTTFPASRNRSSFFVVRGRQVKAVPNQETPIVEQRSPGVRREPPRLSRGARPFPVQPQIAVPPPVIGNRVDSQRGKITSVQRGRQWSVVPPQATVVLIWVPRQVPGHRRVILPSRGRAFAPVPAQVTVPVLVFPNRVDSQRSKIAALYRGKRWDVIPPQVVVVSVWVPTFISPNSTFY